MIHRLYLLLLTIALTCVAVTAEYVIEVSPTAIPAERTAALELQRLLRQATGQELRIVDHAEGRPAILIGQSPRIAELLGGVDFASLKPDEIILKSVGDDLILSGQRPRGTLYAAYTLLEDQLGFRFWTASETDIPAINPDDLDFSGIDERYAPPFTVRTTHYFDALWQGPAFAAQMRSNGEASPVTTEYGGSVKTLGLCHTFDQLLPTATELPKHPEWFSLVDGKRTGGLSSGQLCLTNTEMRDELIRRARQWLAGHPEITTISISQNDTGAQFCECPACRDLTELEGGRQSGVLLHFVNAVAAELEKERPGLMVETLAYNYTVEPPLRTLPRDNVIIRLCVVNTNHAYPLDSNNNADFRTILSEWGKAAKCIAIWDYRTNFKNYFLPQPNLPTIGADFQWFRDHHVTSMFVQGDALSSGTGGDLAPLRLYVTRKLLWNPDLDADLLIAEFLTRYYGEAAPYLQKYIAVIHQSAVRPEASAIGMYMDNTDSWLPMKALLEGVEVMRQAVAAVKGDATLEKRAKLAQAGIHYALLLRPEIAASPEQYGFSFGQLQEIARETLEISEGDHPLFHQEGGPFGFFALDLRRRYRLLPPVDVSRLPEQFHQEDPERLILLPHDSFRLHAKGVEVFEIDDPKASGGKAWSMPSNHHNWSIQHQLPAVRGKFRIFAAIRIEAKPDAAPTGLCMIAGIHGGNYSGSPWKEIQAEDFPSPDYRYIELGEYELTGKDETFYCAPTKHPGIAALVVDQVLLQQVE